MKHLQKFEDLDYKSKLAAETKLRQDFEKSEDEKIEQRRKETSGRYLPELEAGSKKRQLSSQEEDERKEIVQKVIDGLVADLNNNPGYQSFKEELLTFLGEFPKE
jgi:hypothetical protein